MLRVWWQAARPKTLVASVCPVAMGTALADRDGVSHAAAALAALIGALAIQIGTNFANDYFDHRQGADTADRLGPVRAVQAGIVTPRAMLWATCAAFGTAGVASGLLVARAGWPLAVLGAVSIACGIGYTASRFSLAYLGLGDLFVLIFFGPVAVAGTYYVQALRLPFEPLLAGLGPGLIAVGILIVNNIRDVTEDAQANKRTLAVRYGLRFARAEYWICMALAAIIPVLLWASGGFPVAILASSMALLPGLWTASQLHVTRGRDLNPFLASTAGVLILYTLVFCMACVGQ